MATTSGDVKQQLAASIVAACVANDAVHKRFMNNYHSSASADDVKAYLISEFGLPDDLATEIVGMQDQQLSNYIGQLVCDYLW